jgi:hypothetical protein
MRKPAIAYIITFPPIQCDIATYTYDFSLHFHNLYSHILPIKAEMIFDYNSSFKRVSKSLNYIFSNSSIEELNNRRGTIFYLQHEFKLFGGQYGEEVIELVSCLKNPLVATLHTVREELRTRKKIIEAIVGHCELLYIFQRVQKDIYMKDIL